MKTITNLSQMIILEILLAGILISPQSTLAQDNPWTTKKNIPTARMNMAACEVNGKIYVLGGATYSGSPGLTTVEEFDPATDTWTEKSPMPTARAGLSACAVNGKIYAIGGGLSWGGTCVSIVEEYDPATNTWTTKTEMPTARANLSSCVVDDKIYAIGGAKSSAEIFSTVEVYDPATDTWTTKTKMPTARNFPSTCVLNGKIYVIGGAFSQQGLTSKVEIFDPETETWSDTSPDMQTVRAGFGTSLVNGRIYAFGGISSMLAAPMSSMEEYDPATATWTLKSNMLTGRLFMTSATVNNKIYIIGGTVNGISNIVLTNRVEEYDPELDIELSNSVESLNDNIPAAFMLYQNYPNPFSSTTSIHYKLFTHADVKISVYDILGHEIQVLANENQTQGEYHVNFDAKNLAKGVCYCKIQADTDYGNITAQVIKLIISK